MWIHRTLRADWPDSLYINACIVPVTSQLQLITNATMMPLFQSPMAIISEICTSKARGIALGWAFVTWAIGSCFLPLVAWLIPYWRTLQARPELCQTHSHN